MNKGRLSIFFLSLLCFLSTREQHAIRMPEWGQHIPKVLQRLIVEHKKLSTAALLAATVLYQLRAKWNVKILKDRDNVYTGQDICTVFNPGAAAKNLVFYFPGHKAFAERDLHQQTVYGGNPLMEQFSFSFKEQLEMCEVMTRFEETILNREYRSYFGQIGDVKQALGCLGKHHRKNSNRINIVGRSRGGHVAAIILGFLSAPENFRVGQQHLVIDSNVRKVIIEKLQRGHIIFCVPLIDMPSTLFETRGMLYGGLLQAGLLSIISGLRYGQEQETHAIDLLTAVANSSGFQNPNFNMTVIFANEDRTVGVNEQLRNRFIEALGKFGTVEVIYVPGGHNDRFQRAALLNTIAEKILHKAQ